MAEGLEINDWYYRGEGNCSLVIANTKEHIVIRLLKRKKRVQNGKKQKMDSAVQQEHLEKGARFVQHVMQPLIGPHFVQLGELLELSSSFPEQVNKKVDDDRPVHRIDKEVDPDCLLGIKLPDFCFVSSDTPTPASSGCPTFCVEIKPKCGFLPSHGKVSGQWSVSSRVCTFCMHQHLKLKIGKWQKRSGYCPIDLFSGNIARMKHTLKELFRTPQNNLRLFKDGEILLSEEIRTDYSNHLQDCFGPVADSENNQCDQCEGVVDTFQDLLVKCLLHVPKTPDSKEGPQHQVEPSSSQSCTQHCEASSYSQQTSGTDAGQTATGLPGGCVLERLLAVQQLDDLDIQGIQPLYQRVAQHFLSSKCNREASYIDGDYQHFWEKRPELNPSDSDSTVGLSHCLHKVKKFLVAKTARDCSIMIAIKPYGESGPVDKDLSQKIITDLHGNRFLFSIAVIDLDPKSFDKFPTYIKDNEKVVDYYLQVTKDQ